MTTDKPPSGELVWAAVRQQQALRESLAWTLDGKFLFQATEEEVADLEDAPDCTDGWTLLSLSEKTVPIWLRQQGLGRHISASPTNIGTAIESYRIEALGSDAYKAVRSGQRYAHQTTEDFGAERSGAGWFRSINFCITSAFVRLLGAWEQYEIDVLKALFFFRPSGKPIGEEEEHLDQPDDQGLETLESIVREEPQTDPEDKNKLIYQKPPVWTWVRRHAEGNEERRRILRNVFRINPTPPGEKDKRRRDWYESRNAIAHGRTAVEMTLAEYIAAEVYAYRSIKHVASECYDKHKLIV